MDNTIEARKGILDGWYATDGGNSNRCYTISETLIEQMTLCTTLGIQTYLIEQKKLKTNEQMVFEVFKIPKIIDANYNLLRRRWNLCF